MEVGLIGWAGRALRVGMLRVVFILGLGHGFVPQLQELNLISEGNTCGGEELCTTDWAGDENVLVITTQTAFKTTSQTAMGTGYMENRDAIPSPLYS